METWYVMEDGSCGDPREITEGADGILRHSDGRAVAYRPDGVTPRSRGCVDADAERAKALAEQLSKDSDTGKGKPKPKDVKPEDPKLGYKTRESKAD